MNEEALIWQNKAAEAEQKRVAAQNKMTQLQVQCDQLKRALDEAKQFVLYHLHKQQLEDKQAEERGLPVPTREKYPTHAIRALDYMMSVSYTASQTGFQKSNPPDEPETDDWYYDGKKLHWYYLGRWHEERQDE